MLSRRTDLTLAHILSNSSLPISSHNVQPPPLREAQGPAWQPCYAEEAGFSMGGDDLGAIMLAGAGRLRRQSMRPTRLQVHCSPRCVSDFTSGFAYDRQFLCAEMDQTHQLYTLSLDMSSILSRVTHEGPGLAAPATMPNFQSDHLPSCPATLFDAGLAVLGFVVWREKCRRCLAPSSNL